MWSPAARVAYGITIFFVGLVFVGLRLYIRYWLSRGVARSGVYFLSDAFIVAALAFAASCVGMDTNARLHMKGPVDTSIESADRSLKSAFYNYVVGWVALWFIKFAFLCQFFTVARSLKRTAYWALMGTTGLVVTAFATTILWIFLRCERLDMYWTMGPQSCILKDFIVQSSVVSALHLFSDLATLLMGYVIVSATFNIGRREHAALAFIYALGLLSMGAHSIRFALSLRMEKSIREGADPMSPEGLQMDLWLYCASVAEMGIGILTASLPSLRVWIRSRKKGSGSPGIAEANDRVEMLNFEPPGGGFEDYVSIDEPSVDGRRITLMSADSGRDSLRLHPDRTMRLKAR